jgi:hypothetical protein
MCKRGLLAAVLMAVLLTPHPSVSQGQGVVVDHKEIKCIVAGKFTRVNACFDPSANLARGRAYFRAFGTQPWYYVEFKADQPCFLTYFPKARKDTEKVEYYVEGLSKDSATQRTADYDPIVVEREEDCKDRPVAGFVNKADVLVGSVAGGPAVPAGFLIGGGVSGGLIIGGVVAAAAVGGAVAIANNNDGGTPSTPTLPPPPSVTQPPPTSPPPTNPPPTQGEYRFIPRFSISPDPALGTEPIRVTFDMCASEGSNLRFRFDFDGDGATDQAGTSCAASRTYTTGGVSSSGRKLAAAPPTTLGPRKSLYVTQMSVRDDRGNAAAENNNVEVIEALKKDDDLAGSGERRLAWASELDLEGGTGQVVVNGSAAVFASKGRSTAVAVGRRGENRVEAVVVQASGKAGTWRLELGGTTSFRPGSLRIIAGDVAMMTADAVVFRLSGKPGDRLMFTFRTED